MRRAALLFVAAMMACAPDTPGGASGVGVVAVHGVALGDVGQGRPCSRGALRLRGGKSKMRRPSRPWDKKKEKAKGVVKSRAAEVRKPWHHFVGEDCVLEDVELDPEAERNENKERRIRAAACGDDKGSALPALERARGDAFADCCWVLNNILNATDILEVGCGDGHLARQAVRLCPKVGAYTIVDKDKQVLDLALRVVTDRPISVAVAPRSKPLLLTALHGNAASLSSSHLKDSEGAMVAVLYDIVQQLSQADAVHVAEALFDRIRPKYVLVVVPQQQQHGAGNGETGPLGWTRERLAAWAEEVCKRHRGYAWGSLDLERVRAEGRGLVRSRETSDRAAGDEHPQHRAPNAVIFRGSGSVVDQEEADAEGSASGQVKVLASLVIKDAHVQVEENWGFS